jgi:hypothetical protein
MESPLPTVPGGTIDLKGASSLLPSSAIYKPYSLRRLQFILEEILLIKCPTSAPKKKKAYVFICKPLF